MADRRPIFEYNEESQADKFARKSKDSPFMIVGKQHFELEKYITKWDTRIDLNSIIIIMQIYYIYNTNIILL